jgi:hypothetical protein
MQGNQVYEEAIQREARFYNVQVQQVNFKKRYAYIPSCNIIRIPVIDNEESFFSSLYIMSKFSVRVCKPAYIFEYKSVLWVLERMRHYNAPITQDIQDLAMRFVIYALMKSHNRKGDVSKIPIEIREFVKSVEPDFNSWKGKQVYFSGSTNMITKVHDERIAQADDARKATKRKRITNIFLNNKDDV